MFLIELIWRMKRKLLKIIQKYFFYGARNFKRGSQLQFKNKKAVKTVFNDFTNFNFDFSEFIATQQHKESISRLSIPGSLKILLHSYL